MSEFSMTELSKSTIEPDPIVLLRRPSIVVTAADRERLLALEAHATEQMPEIAHFLKQEIERAVIIPSDAAIASSFVRMGSAVKFIDHRRDVIQHGRLVYPEEDKASPGAISVLTPIGVALLGLGPGQSIAWSRPTGETVRISLLEVDSHDTCTPEILAR
jgi:regulator of nucleoside diphosphate kinase